MLRGRDRKGSPRKRKIDVEKEKKDWQEREKDNSVDCIPSETQQNEVLFSLTDCENAFPSDGKCCNENRRIQEQSSTSCWETISGRPTHENRIVSLKPDDHIRYSPQSTGESGPISSNPESKNLWLSYTACRNISLAHFSLRGRAISWLTPQSANRAYRWLLDKQIHPAAVGLGYQTWFLLARIVYLLRLNRTPPGSDALGIDTSGLRAISRVLYRMRVREMLTGLLSSWFLLFLLFLI